MTKFSSAGLADFSINTDAWDITEIVMQQQKSQNVDVHTCPHTCICTQNTFVLNMCIHKTCTHVDTTHVNLLHATHPHTHKTDSNMHTLHTRVS